MYYHVPRNAHKQALNDCQYGVCRRRGWPSLMWTIYLLWLERQRVAREACNA